MSVHVTAMAYGPVTVVRNSALAVTLAAADGPEGMPVTVSCHRSLSDGRVILLAATAAERAWADAGGMPWEVRRAFEDVVRFDPLRLLLDTTRRGRPLEAGLYSRQTIR